MAPDIRRLRLAEHADGTAAGEGASSSKDPPVPREVAAYLTTMTQNLALDRLHRGQRYARHVRDQTLQVELAPPHVPDVAESVMYGQALAALQVALASLPERTRAAFVAHRVQGEKQPVIAERLGVSVNTVERDLIQAGACIEDALHRWRGTPMGSVKRRPRAVAAAWAHCSGWPGSAPAARWPGSSGASTVTRICSGHWPR